MRSSPVLEGEDVEAVAAVLQHLTEQVIAADATFQKRQRDYWLDLAHAAGRAFIGEGVGRQLNLALSSLKVTFAVIEIRVGFWRRLLVRILGRRWSWSKRRFRIALPHEEGAALKVTATISRDATGRWVSRWQPPGSEAVSGAA